MRRFLVVGRTGVGKSSFVNSVFGKYITETSRYESCTKIIHHHAYSSPQGDICLIDTPGLAEDDIECDKKYLDLIKASVDFSDILPTLNGVPLQCGLKSDSSMRTLTEL